MSALRTGRMPVFLFRDALQPHVLAIEGEAARLDNMCRIDRYEDVVAGPRNRAGSGILKRILELKSQRVPGNAGRSFRFRRGAVAIDPGGVKADLHLSSGLLDAQLKHRTAAEKFLLSVLAGPTGCVGRVDETHPGDKNDRGG